MQQNPLLCNIPLGNGPPGVVCHFGSWLSFGVFFVVICEEQQREEAVKIRFEDIWRAYQAMPEYLQIHPYFMRPKRLQDSKKYLRVFGSGTQINIETMKKHPDPAKMRYNATTLEALAPHLPVLEECCRSGSKAGSRSPAKGQNSPRSPSKRQSPDKGDSPLASPKRIKAEDGLAMGVDRDGENEDGTPRPHWQMAD